MVQAPTRQIAEFVVGGYTSGNPFEGLLVGYYKGRKLNLRGEGEAGFTPSIRRELFAKLAPLVTDKCPFANLPEKIAGHWGEGLTKVKMLKCTWTKPKLVAQVSFVEWTKHNHLRHATFLGLRDDKRPSEVRREL